MKLFHFRKHETITQYPYKSIKITHHFAFFPKVAFRHIDDNNVDHLSYGRLRKLYIFWFEKYIKEYYQTNQFEGVHWLLKTVCPEYEFIKEKLEN